MRRCALSLVVLVTAAVCGCGGPQHASEPVSITIDRDVIVARSEMLMGVTHTQSSIEPGHPRAARKRAARLLRGGNVLQNQHIMGWGANNPEPVRGEFRWGSLDRRVALIRRTGGTPMLTLCCAPDWMKGGRPGRTDWSTLERAPDPDHYGDFARLAAAVARRYRDIRHFQVWNELKGFWNQRANRWSYKRYTQLYNRVYDAVKAVRPDALIGGPYVVLDSYPDARQPSPSAVGGDWGRLDQRALDVIVYWLRHKHGADFISLDASNAQNRAGRSVDGYRGCRLFSAATRWLRSLDDPGARTLPLFWAEWYAWARGGPRGPQQVSSVMAECLRVTLVSGAAATLVWSPEEDRSTPRRLAGLWTSTGRRDGGRPTPYYEVHRAVRTHFGPGAPIYRVRTSSRDVTALATQGYALVVNHRSRALNVSIDGGQPHRVGPYGVALLKL